MRGKGILQSKPCRRCNLLAERIQWHVDVEKRQKPLRCSGLQEGGMVGADVILRSKV